MADITASVAAQQVDDTGEKILPTPVNQLPEEVKRLLVEVLSTSQKKVSQM